MKRSTITQIALVLVLLGIVEDITGALILLGLVTSAAGVGLYLFKGGRKR